MPALARGVVFGRGGTFWPGVSWALWLGAGPGACRGHAVAVPPGEPCVERGGRQHRGPLPGPGAQSSALAGLFLLPCPLRLLALGPPSRSVRRLLSGLRQGPSRARLWPVAQPSCTAGQWPWGHPRPLSWPAPPGHSCQPHSQGMCAHSQMAGGGGFGLLTPQWAGGGTGWDAGAGLGDTCRLRSRPAGPAQTCPSPVDTGQAPPRVPGLTDQGGLGAEGSRPAMGGWDSGGLAWMGRAKGFLEEVLQATLVCRMGGEVILVGVWEGPGFPPLTDVGGHCSCCPPCQPACLLALHEPWQGPWPVPACP